MRKNFFTCAVAQAAIILFIASSLFAPVYAAPRKKTAAAKTPATLKPSAYVAMLLKNKQAVYWYTDATDADHPALAADGTFGVVKLLEGTSFSESYRQLLRSNGIIPVAHVEISPESDAGTLYDEMKAPLAAGWDAIAIDEIMAGDPAGNIAAALKRIRKDYPGRAVIIWAQAGSDVIPLEKLVDLFILLPGRNPDKKVFLTETSQGAPAARLKAAEDELRARGVSGAAILKKTIAAVCVCDYFDDTVPNPDAFVCDDSEKVNFTGFIDEQLHAAAAGKDFPNGAAFFSWRRAKNETARFANLAAGRYFLDSKKVKLLPADSSSASLKNPGFENNDESWRIDGKGARVVAYRDAGPAVKLRMGHAYNSTGGNAAEVSHGVRVFRMDGAPGNCGMASQKIDLEPGATYALSAFVTGAKGTGKASMWIVDPTEGGKERFSAFHPVPNVPASEWLEAKAVFTLPSNVKQVMVALSDCDAREPQTIWWDFAELERLLPASATPGIISATPVLNTVEGRGFRVQWTPLPNKKISHYLLQISVDGKFWTNIASEFEGEYMIDWFPGGMKTMPFERIAPGQTVYFRIKANYWDDKSSDWSKLYRSVMPATGADKEPVLLYAVSLQAVSPKAKKGVRVAWTAPQKEKPVKYLLHMKIPGGTWTKIGQASPGALKIEASPDMPSGVSPLFRLTAVYPGGDVLSNITPLIR